MRCQTFNYLMSPSGNGRKSLAFRRSLQVDHSLLPQLKLGVYCRQANKDQCQSSWAVRSEKGVGHLFDLLVQVQRLYMATNCMSVHGT